MSQTSTDSPSSAPRARVRRLAVAAAMAGVVLAIVVVGYFNVGQVLAAMQRIGLGGFAAAIAAQVVLFLPLGMAWWVLTERDRPLSGFIWSRLIREAVSDLLPLSQLGGLAGASRAVTLCGVSAAVAAGSSLADAMIEAVAQLTYTAVGLAILAESLGGASSHLPLLRNGIIGVAVSTVMIGVGIATHRRWTGWIGGKISQVFPALAGQADAVGVAVNRGLGRPARLVTALILHVSCWFGAAGGTWLMLAFLGHRVSFSAVVGLESLLFAIRNAAFMAPSGVGVQEAAYALLGPLFGIPPQAALALSLLKRGRDLCVGLPLLLSWQWAERRHAARSAQKPPAGPSGPVDGAASPVA